MSEILALEHAAIHVNDIEKSRHFYQDLLGLDVVMYVEHEGGAIAELCAIEGTYLKEYRMRPPQGPGPAGKAPGFTLDLLQIARPAGQVRRPAVNDAPMAHFAFGVKDLQATYERLVAAGVEFVSPPVTFPEAEGGWRVVFFRDPDGHLLELTQVD
jgi:catechol 2,3-dioxygenase-like lactoylglutathione lyase family enzyme